MINISSLTLAFGKKTLFKNVTLRFNPGNTYGLIGANGSGKSTFLKVLSGEIEPNEGIVLFGRNQRIAMLEQNQFKYDEFPVLDTVIMGYKNLYDVLKERNTLYAKPDFSEVDGHKASDLEEAFGRMNGYEAETDAAVLLSGLGIGEEFHSKKMKELEGGEKVRVLLAQVLFGNPEILLLDEPTNHLDIESITWLENFLYNFNNTVIVVSHDRHFINKVCTHIADIDFGTIKIYTGNYDFWAQASQLSLQQKKEENKKKEEIAKDLQAFIARFSANASKSKQATSRKKLLEKLTIDEIPVSSRRFPYVAFKPERECGAKVLSLSGLCKTIDGTLLLKDFSLTVNRGDKIAFFGQNNLVKTTLFRIIMEELKPDGGTVKWGETIKPAYFPKENSAYFTDEVNLIEWLRQNTKVRDESSIRGFLGRMLFSGDESLKKVTALSGGEKVRCMLAKMMLHNPNALVMDEPTSHLDLESITALNNGLTGFSGVILLSSHDHELLSSVANRIIEITPSGVIDRVMPFEEYIENKDVLTLRDKMYHGHRRLSLD